MKIGEHKILPKGSKIFSFKKTIEYTLDKDIIVRIEFIGNDMKVVGTISELEYYLFIEKPTLCGTGPERFSFNYSDTLPFNEEHY